MHEQSPEEGPKNIVICSDGTGNSAIKGRGTNVFKLFEAVDVVGHLTPSGSREQVAIYDDGVGTQKLKVFRLLAGAFGMGLARNVRQLYTELSRCYLPGDDIYMFGFSRGAFTVRTLAGFIDHAGILDPSGLTAGELIRAVNDKYRAYRKSRPALLERALSPISSGLRGLWRLVSGFRETPIPLHPERAIRFVGVWDTVDSVGFPFPGIGALWNGVVHRYKFTDLGLPECVGRACHALAIDEERASFAPTLWRHEPNRTEQVWFGGVHSNVGGGYPKQGMSLVALDWILALAREASAGELRFADGLRAQYREASNVNDCLYDSRSGLAIYYRYLPRDIAELCKKVGAPVRIHHSALDRIRKRTRGYAPANLPDAFEIVGTPGETVRPGPTGAVHLKGSRLPKSARPRGLWVRWRQATQVVFYGLQITLLLWAVSDSLRGEVALAEKPGRESLTRAELATQGFTLIVKEATELGMAAMAKKRILEPMLASPRIGVSFLVAFPLCWLLGLIGRVRIESLSSERWRQTSLVAANRATDAGGTPLDQPS
jgi:uncharacterized protein (DUF2235 family)